MSSSIFSALAAASRIPSAQPEHLRPLHVSATVKAAGHADGFRRDRPDHPLHDRLSHWLRCHAGETLFAGISFQNIINVRCRKPGFNHLVLTIL